MSKRKPEEQALRATLREWQEAINDTDRLEQDFVRDALLAVFEGMLNLEERMAWVLKTDWKNGAIIQEFQDELNMMRYKMINLDSGLRAVQQTDFPDQPSRAESAGQTHAE